MRHVFAQMELMVWCVGGREAGSEDDEERSRGKGKAKVAGTDSIFGHTSE